MDDHSNIAIKAMAAIFNRQPRGFQLDVITHLLKMLSGSIPKQPVLMVQPTGSGKSTVPLTVAVIDGGITIVLENTLALGTDQSSKIDIIAKSSRKRTIKSIHLDSIKGSKLQHSISKSLVKHCKGNKNTSIIIFSSPESLLKPIWTKFVLDCAKHDILNLICIDEIHMFVEFGCTFRPCFQMLNKSIFSRLCIDSATSSVPLLLMTATFDKQYQSILQKMIGFDIQHHNTFWARQGSFNKRHIDINFRYSTQHFRLMKEYLCDNLSDNHSDKAIIITNTALCATQCQNELNNWLDVDNKLGGDSVLVIGERDPELKFAYTTSFTNTPFNATSGNENNILQPRYLIGTTGCIGAGLDCLDVHLVIRFGLSTNIINFIQEMGRCGRDNASVNTTSSKNIDYFNIIFNVQDFVYLHKRLHIENYQNDTSEDLISDDDRVVSEKEMVAIEINNFMRLCTMLFLNVGCWHYYLETSSTNPDLDPYDPRNYNPCMTHCPYCTNKISSIVKAVNKEQLCIFLVETMTNTTKTFNLIQLGNALFEFPDSGTLIYNRTKGKKPQAKSDCYLTIIQLILADIVRLLFLHPSFLLVPM